MTKKKLAMPGVTVHYQIKGSSEVFCSKACSLAEFFELLKSGRLVLTTLEAV